MVDLWQQWADIRRGTLTIYLCVVSIQMCWQTTLLHKLDEVDRLTIWPLAIGCFYYSYLQTLLWTTYLRYLLITYSTCVLCSPAIFKGLAFDSLQRSLYCTDSENGRILKITLNGTSDVIFNDTNSKPLDITVDDRNRWCTNMMYFYLLFHSYLSPKVYSPCE